MRMAVVLVAGCLWAASAFASTIPDPDNVALTSLGAAATTNAYLSYKGVDYIPSNAIDGDPNTEWVAPGGTVGPYLLINLGSVFSVDSINVTGVGNPGLTTSFNIYAGTSSDLATLESGSPVLSVVNQADGGAGWSLTANFTATSIQYVLYLATNSTSGCPGPCYPGNAYFDASGNPTGGQDDAFLTGIVVDDPAPEPISGGITGAALLLMLASVAFRSQASKRQP